MSESAPSVQLRGLPGRSVSCVAALAATAGRRPDDPAVTCGPDQITWAQLEQRSNRWARAFQQRGVGHGDHVTIALPNGVDFLVAAVAAWKAGAVPQPVSHRLPARERQAIVDLARSPVVVGAPAEDHPGRQVLPLGWQPDASIDDGPLPEVVSPAWKAPTSGGSTGRPKLIVATERAEIQPDAPAPFGLPFDGTVLVPGPLYHNAPFGFATRALVQGDHVVLLPRFDAEAALAAIDQHRPSLVLLVPTMMQRIWRLPVEVRDRYDLSSLEVVWHMASPCPPWLKRAWIDWIGGERLFELYAGTEAQAVTVVRGDEWLQRPGTVGKVVGGEMSVRDPVTLEVLPPGEVGEVYLRSTTGPTYRYVGAEARVIDEGWESLGDMGSMDAEGYLFLADRQADMILAGGANIYPAEVEAALDEHPAVVSCAVIGLPDEDLGNRVHAVVEVADPGGVEIEDLRAFVAERLVRYKVPRTFELVTSTVRDHAGKVRRSQLRAERLGEATTDG